MTEVSRRSAGTSQHAGPFTQANCLRSRELGFGTDVATFIKDRLATDQTIL